MGGRPGRRLACHRRRPRLGRGHASLFDFIVSVALRERTADGTGVGAAIELRSGWDLGRAGHGRCRRGEPAQQRRRQPRSAVRSKRVRPFGAWSSLSTRIRGTTSTWAPLPAKRSARPRRRCVEGRFGRAVYVVGPAGTQGEQEDGDQITVPLVADQLAKVGEHGYPAQDGGAMHLQRMLRIDLGPRLVAEDPEGHDRHVQIPVAGGDLGDHLLVAVDVVGVEGHPGRPCLPHSAVGVARRAPCGDGPGRPARTCVRRRGAAARPPQARCRIRRRALGRCRSLRFRHARSPTGATSWVRRAKSDINAAPGSKRRRMVCQSASRGYIWAIVPGCNRESLAR